MKIISQGTVSFIRNYVINNVPHSNPLCEDDIVEITEYITVNYETGLLDNKYDKPTSGSEKLYKQAVKAMNELLDDDIDLIQLSKDLL